MHDEYRKLLIAPTNMRERFRSLIGREAEHAEAGRPARIVAKMNRLEDPEIVAELYWASAAGVDIDLIVRDICRLRPGLPEISETVEVRSIVGQFLEHSRVFRFENGGDPSYYIGSADWMTRNLDKRVEVVTPIEDPRLQDRLDEVLSLMLADNRRAWLLQADGSYEQAAPGEDEVIDAQQRLKRWARQSAATANHARESAANGRGARPRGPEFPDADIREQLRRQARRKEADDDG